MCRVMSVSRSGYYEWLSRPASKRFQEDQALKADIREIHEKSRKNYGERRIKDDLADMGKTASSKDARYSFTVAPCHENSRFG